MSVETVISLSILLGLSYLIWRLNRTKIIYKTRVNRDKSSSSKRSLKSSLYSENIKEELVNEVKATNSNFELPADFLAFKLYLPETLDDEQQEVIQDIIQSFRKPHPLLIPLIRGGFEPNELFDLIKTDAEMTAKVLNVVNSPLFSLRQPITNINHAIIFLGITQVKNIATQLAVQHNLKLTDQAQNDAYKNLWMASYLASSFCLLLAKEVGEENAAELSTHCLLSYLGDLAILPYRPSVAGFYLDDYSLFERAKVFQETMGINTAVVGKSLAQQWQLPKTIETGIEYSLSPLINGAVNKGLSAETLRHILLCYISCRLADLVAFGSLRRLSESKVLSFEDTGIVEFYYTQNNINKAGLDKINTLLNDVSFRKKINKIIEQHY